MLEKDINKDIEYKYRVELARQTLINQKNDESFLKTGRRNDDCVNFLICLNIVRGGGVEDLDLDCIKDILEQQMEVNSTIDIEFALDHIERIKGYLAEWYSPTYRYGYNFLIAADKNICWDTEFIY